jgi:hypothetical protein
MSTTRHPRPMHPGRHAKSQHVAADGALSRLIDNAAPPRDYRRELRGEKEAVAAFAKARLNPAAEPRRRLLSAGKLLTLKTVIAVVGLSGGSVALASATGNLPAQLGGHPVAASSASSSASARTDARDAHRPPATPSPSPSPSMRGLCHAYTAGAGSNPGKALDDPAFSALVSAAGGKEEVTSYCASVLTAAPGHSAGHGTGSGKGNKDASGNSGEGNSDSGSSSAHVSNKPDKAHSHPSPHPRGKPSLHPATS